MCYEKLGEGGKIEIGKCRHAYKVAGKGRHYC